MISLAERRELEQQMALALNAWVEVVQGVADSVDLSVGSRLVQLRKEFSDGAFLIDPAVGVLLTDSAGRSQVLVPACEPTDRSARPAGPDGF